MEVRRVEMKDEQALMLPNEPFALFGRLVVERADGAWSYAVERFEREDEETMVFPDEAYSFAEVEAVGFAVGAFDQGNCVGLAVYRYDWNRYVYLYDLKVNGAYRQQGIAGRLLEVGMAEARKLGYFGMSTIAQDNNLAACLFYLKQGFVIGGLNTKSYEHTTQKGKSDIYFYLEDPSNKS